jgi:hypothetical protein
MNEPAMSNRATAEVDLLIETDSRILDQVRKDLTQEYLRIMSQALQVSRRSEPGEATTPAAIPNSSEG